MNDALVYISAILFFISVFPLHVINYVYVNSEEKYASINVTLYRLITVLNVNTEREPDKKDKPKDNDKKMMTVPNWLKIFNSLCITKIVQLGDYGIQNPDNVYAALANNALTNAGYMFIRLNGGKTKLRNYSVLNYEHDGINYYLKLVGIINVMTLLKLLAIFYWGKINEQT